MVADINHPKLEDWKELVPESEAVLSNAEVIGGKLFLTYDKDASNHAYVYDLDGKQFQEIRTALARFRRIQRQQRRQRMLLRIYFVHHSRRYL